MRFSDWSSDVFSSDLFSASIRESDKRSSTSRCTRCASSNMIFRKRSLVPGSPPAFGSLRVSIKRSEEHTSELQSLMSISYAVFGLKKKNTTTLNDQHITDTTARWQSINTTHTSK